ncbi:MAG: hypothetical protein ACLQG3_14475 [Terracidiphilus sp.]
MKRISFYAALGLLTATISGAQTTETLVASHLTDSLRVALNGYVTLQPTLTSGAPTWYRMPGGGVVSNAAVKILVVDGALSAVLPDVTLTEPENICFAMSYNGVAPVAGYQCIQPHATATNGSDWCQAGVCNLDNYTPNLAPQATMSTVLTINGAPGNWVFSGNVTCNSATRTCVVNNGSGTASVGDSDVTGQTTSQSTVNIVGTVPFTETQRFRISYYANQNAMCTTGMESVRFSFGWTDAVANRSVSSVALTLGSVQLAGTGSIQGTITIYATASTAITYISTVTGSCATGGPASYDAHIAVESIQ